MGLSGAAYEWGAKRDPSLKSVTRPRMMKLGKVVAYLKTIQKFINLVKHPLSFVDIIIFHQKSATFVISRNTYIDCILIVNL